MTAAELVELLETVEVELDADPDPEAVLIAEPLAIRARRFRRVIVAGLCEGEFPSRRGAATRSSARTAAGSWRSLPASSCAPSPTSSLASATCCTRAYRARPSVSASATAAPTRTANSCCRRRFWRTSRNCSPGWRERRRRRLLADVVWSPEEAPTPRERGWRRWRRAQVASGGPRAVQAGDRGSTRRLGEAAMAHVRHDSVVSAGALEKFAACPVQWLVERQLAPEQLAPDAEPSRAALHARVLEQVISRLEAADPAELAGRRAGAGRADRRAAPDLAPGRPEAVRVAILRGIEADLRRYLRFEADDGNDWMPTELELAFEVELGSARTRSRCAASSTASTSTR